MDRQRELKIKEGIRKAKLSLEELRKDITRASKAGLDVTERLRRFTDQQKRVSQLEQAFQ